MKTTKTLDTVKYAIVEKTENGKGFAFSHVGLVNEDGKFWNLTLFQIDTKSKEESAWNGVHFFDSFGDALLVKDYINPTYRNDLQFEIVEVEFYDVEVFDDQIYKKWILIDLLLILFLLILVSFGNKINLAPLLYLPWLTWIVFDETPTQFATRKATSYSVELCTKARFRNLANVKRYLVS